MPFNPQIRDQRADFIYQGKAALGAGIAGGIGQFGDVMGNAMQQQVAARDESEALRDSLLFAGQNGYMELTPEMIDQFDSANLKGKKEMYATAMAMAELDNKRRLSRENMDYNAMRTQETSDYASQVRQNEAAAQAQSEYQRKNEVLNAMIRDRRASGEISDAEAERVRAVGEIAPEEGMSLLESITTATGPVGPPNYQTYEIPGVGTIVRDEVTGQEVSSSRINRPPGTGTGSGGSRAAGAPIIDPNNPTGPAVTTPGGSPAQAPNSLDVDWFFGR